MGLSTPVTLLVAELASDCFCCRFRWAPLFVSEAAAVAADVLFAAVAVGVGVCCCLPKGCFWVPRPVEGAEALVAALAVAAAVALALVLAPPPRTDWDSDSDGRGPLSRKGLPVA